MIFYVIPNFSEAVSKSQAHRDWKRADSMSRSKDPRRAGAGAVAIRKLQRSNSKRSPWKTGDTFSNFAAQARKQGDKVTARRDIKSQTSLRKSIQKKGFKLP